MKYIFIFLSLSLLLCCTSGKNTDDKPVHFAQLDTLKNFGGMNGDWLLYKIKGNGVETTFPPSYKVKLKETDGSAVVIKPGMEEFFTWQTEGEQIKIRTKGINNESVTFSDSVYTMHFSFSHDNIDLELRSQNGWYSYILRKELLK